MENPLTKEINPDIILIKVFTNKALYTKYKAYINTYLINNYKLNNKTLYKLYRCLDLLYGEHDSVSLEDIYLRLLREYPALSPDESVLARETVQKALQADFNEAEVEGYITRQYEAAKASDVALKAIQVTEGKASIADLKEMLAKDDLAESQKEKVLYENDLAGLFASTKGKNGIRWPLMSLNKTLGSLRPGDFGFLFARPEVGKTTFLSHVATHACKETGQGVLWINNEEGGNKVLLRCYQSLVGVSTNRLFEGIEAYQAEWDRYVGDRLRLVNDPGISSRAVEKLVEEFKPALVIFDQLDKVVGFDAERNDLVLKAKYQWARELGKRYSTACVGVCQAGGTAENKKKLAMTDVDSSHTAKQGEADWILGIGKVDQDGLENVRYFTILKNKLVGDADSDANLRHAHFDALIEPEIGRYKDRIKW